MANKIDSRDIDLIKELMNKTLDMEVFIGLERMGGLTNRTYKVTLDDGRIYVIRIPGEGTEALINREDERISTMLACEIGIDAELLYFGEKGEKVTAYIQNAETLSPETLKKERNLVKAAKVLRTLHTCDRNTNVPFEVFDMASSYEKIIRDNEVTLYEDYPTVKASVMAVKQHIDSNGAVLRVPCHNDPLCENWVLDGNGRMYLIDWEYAGMNDGMWDLADVSIEAAFTDREDALLLSAYFDREPTQEEFDRFLANKLYLDYLWTLWGKTRVPFDGEPMEQYAQERYIRLKSNLKQYFKEWYRET